MRVTWLVETFCPCPRHRDGARLSCFCVQRKKLGEKSSGVTPDFSLRRRYETRLSTQSLGYCRDDKCNDHYGHKFTRTFLEGYPPWVRHGFCDRHKRRERCLLCCNTVLAMSTSSTGFLKPTVERRALRASGLALAILSFQTLGILSLLLSLAHPITYQLRHHLLRHWHLAFVCPQWNLARFWSSTSQGRCHWCY